MKILLETHIFLWWDRDPRLLTPTARALCEDSNNTLVLSIASAWEIQIKVQLGKMDLRLPLNELIADQQKTNGIELLPVTLDHVLALGDLPLHHKDPFDRLLIAQANAEKLSLLSADPIFSEYSVALLR